MSYGILRRPLPHYVCDICGEEFQAGDMMYTLDDGMHICDMCIGEYIDKWKDEHSEVLSDPVNYSGEPDRTDWFER